MSNSHYIKNQMNNFMYPIDILDFHSAQNQLIHPHL